MPVAGLAHALAVLGAEPAAALVRLLELGLLAIEPNAELGPVDDFAVVLKRTSAADLQVLVHPTVPHAVRTVRPEGGLPAVARPGRYRSASRTVWSRSCGSGRCGSGLGRADPQDSAGGPLQARSGPRSRKIRS